ncbi:MAG: hypothetical protein R3F60_23310 [bacterium]
MADWTATEAGIPGDAPEASATLPPRYLSLQAIGLGGMGQVHRVHGRVLDRTLAMKVMLGAPLPAVPNEQFEHDPHHGGAAAPRHRRGA